MTEPRPPRPGRPARPGRPGWTLAITGTLALFLALVLLLGVQMRAGRDPVLAAGSGSPEPKAAPAPRRPAVVVRRVITRRVIRVIHDASAPVGAPASSTPATTRVTASAPAAGPAAAAPAPAPVPAPAPAPLATRSS